MATPTAPLPAEETASSAHERLTASFASHLTLPLSFRLTQLRLLRAHLHANEPSHLAALHADLRKPTPEALIYDLLPLFSDLSTLITTLPRLAAPRLASRSLGAPVYTEPHPKGVVLILGPFNFPTQLVLRPLAEALAAGNCVVVKPSEHAPASAAFLAGLAAALDPRVFACVTGAVEAAQRLLALRWDHVVFTGSPRVARAVMAAAAPHLTPVTLELGGKNPAVVAPSADIDSAAASVVRARFTNAGQICLAVDYCLVHERVFDAFAAKVLEKVRLFYGNTPQRSPAFARLVSARHFEHVTALLAKSAGTVMIGGEADPADHHYVAPTVVAVERGDALLEEEIFGPVLPLLRVPSTADAVDYITAREHPLALYVFSNDKKEVKTVVAHTRSGSVGVNETVLQISGAGSFIGGVGESGIGAYGNGKGFETFSHSRPVLYSTPFWARMLVNMQPHKFMKDGKENKPFLRVVRLVGHMPTPGGSDTPLAERLLGGLRTAAAAAAAVAALLFARCSSRKKDQV